MLAEGVVCWLVCVGMGHPPDCQFLTVRGAREQARAALLAARLQMNQLGISRAKMGVGGDRLGKLRLGARTRFHPMGGLMRRTVLYPGILAAGVALVVAVQAWPYPEFARTTKASCAACHGNVAGGADLTAAGKLFKADRKKVPTKAVTGSDYVGDGRCRGCHIDVHESWQETRHAHALEFLKAAPDTAIAKMARALKVKL